ncbi:ribonuclease domain-containing protein [Chryseobacterium koreense]
MNNPKVKLFLYFIIGVLSAFLAMYFFNNQKEEEKNPAEITQTSASNANESNSEVQKQSPLNSSNGIEDLTAENVVIKYVKKNHRLPDYYLTKSEARKKGWIPSQGNLCEVLPGKAIGGDKFSNREKTLPEGNPYFEADVNFTCGQRQADRIIFTKNGDVWLTKDHYRSFDKK